MRTTRRLDPDRAWSPFEPGPDGPWDRARVAHLHRRAGFAAPWGVLERDLKDGPEISVDRLLNGEEVGPDGMTETDLDALSERFDPSLSQARLQATWLRRMISTPHPLRERLTLFWHDHFATSNAKVNNTGLMARQNALLRQHALGDFKALLAAMARDPAMLVWLDSASNRKAHPNENYAREVMELFTLGRGHYTEKDVQEAARAFTGSFIQDDRFTLISAQHDDGAKTILGQSGTFRGDDVTRILLEQPACADFLAGKLYRHFVDEVEPPSPDLLAPLAESIRTSRYEMREPLKMILRSRLFFDLASRRKRVKGPVEFAVGTVRALEIYRPTVSTEALAEACGRMGQNLYAPPSVAGWDGGPAWINTTTTLARTNFALGLIGDKQRFDAEALAKKHGVEPGSFFVDLLLQDGADESVRRKMKDASLVLTAPEYQLA